MRKAVVKPIVQPAKRESPLNQSSTESGYPKNLFNITNDWYKAIIQSATEGFFLSDLQGNILDVNDAFCRMLGYSREALLSMTTCGFDVELMKAPEKLRQRVLEVKEAGGMSSEMKHRCKDGRIIVVAVNVKYLDNKPGFFFCFHRDITEQKKIHQQLKESEERYRALIELGGRVGEAVVMLQDTDKGKGIQTFVSDKWLHITGYSREELLDMSFFNILHPRYRRDSIERHSRKITGDKMPGYFEMSIIRKDGAEVPIEVTSGYTIYQGKPANVAYIRDITERIEAKEQLLSYQKELRSLTSQLSLAEERERRRIAGELHDHISQTLATCNAKLGAVKKLAPSIRFTEPVAEIQVLIKQLIKETRSLTFELSSPLLYELGIEAALEQLTEQIKEQSGILSKFEDDGQPKPLHEDVRVLLFQMVRELLVNVVKHAQAHKVTVSIGRQDNNVRITVEDDGVGFDTAKTLTDGKGYKGFGLFSIRERLYHLDGHSEVESQHGCGTRVILTVPLEFQ